MSTAETNPQPRLLLIEARNSLNLSQQELAERIGTTYVNISRWERGLTRPGPYYRKRLCVLFRKSEQELNLDGAERRGTTEARGQERQADTEIAPSTKPFIPKPGAVYDPFIPGPGAIALVGRDRELAQLRKLLLRGGGVGSVALTALNGLPGVGKTALSIALAHDDAIREHFDDGVLWAGLGPQPNLSSLLSHWGRILGLPEAEMSEEVSNEARARALRGVIGTRRMLLVIDDAWTLEHALLFKVGGPRCAHLLTTRFPMLAARFTPGGAVSIKELEEESSMRLLSMLAPSVMQQEAQKAQELIAAVGGLPLALTVLGNYLRAQAAIGSKRRMQAALHRLSSAVERLKISDVQAPADAHSSLAANAQLSLETVFAVTYQQLDEQTKKAFYALAVFPAKPNSFSEEAARFVANCTFETLDQLSGTGLLESSGDDRYTLHQTVADYARMQLGDDSTPSERLIEYVMRFVETHRKDYELLERESTNTNILTALELAYEQHIADKLIRITLAFTPYQLSRGFYTQAREQLQRAYEAAEAENNSHHITNILLFWGRIAQKQGEYTLAIEYLQRGLEIAKQTENNEVMSSILDMLGSVAGSRGNYAESERYLLEGLKLAQHAEDLERSCTILINLGVTAGEQGHHAQAEVYFQDALALARQIEHQEWISLLLSNLGETACERQHYDQAEKYFLEGLNLARQIEHREWISVLLLNLGFATRKQSKYSQAERYLKETLSLVRQLDMSQLIANALYEYGNLCIDKSQLEIAEDTFHEMLITVTQDSQDLHALAQYGLARTFAAKGDSFEAKKIGISSMTTLETMGHRYAKEVRNWLTTMENRTSS